MKMIKIFIASSEELREDRDAFDLFVRRKGDNLFKKGIVFSVVRWEYFLDAMAGDGLQSEYNKAVQACDVFVSLFHTKVGKYTEEEFTNALKAYLEKGKPLVYTYFKEEPPKAMSALKEEDFLSLVSFKKKLKDLKHFPTMYKDRNDLELKFGLQLDLILKQLQN